MAQTTPAPGGGGGGLGGMASSQIMLMVVVFAIFYFMLIRPQQKQMAKHRDFLGGLKPGAKVVTQGGIVGVVHKVEEDVVSIEIADKVRIKVMKAQVQGPRPARPDADGKEPASLSPKRKGT